MVVSGDVWEAVIGPVLSIALSSSGAQAFIAAGTAQPDQDTVADWDEKGYSRFNLPTLNQQR